VKFIQLAVDVKLMLFWVDVHFLEGDAVWGAAWFCTDI